MPPAPALRPLVDGLLDAYARQLAALAATVFDTFALIDELRAGQAEAIEALREALARSRTFRRSDFDALAQAHFTRLAEDEERVRGALRRFLHLHTGLAPRLRDALDALDQRAVAALGADSAREEQALRAAVQAFRETHAALLARVRAAASAPQSLGLREVRALLAVRPAA